MRALGMLLAGLGFAVTATFAASSASAGGWWNDEYYGESRVVHHDVYAAPRYVHIYHVREPAPRYVHVIAYEHAGYAAYRYARPYRYGNYWAAPYYRNYYPVRAVYPKTRPVHARSLK